MTSRRQYLGLVSSATVLALAGCAEEEEGPRFLVTNTNYRELGPNIEVQVTIENGNADDRTGTLEVILRHEPRDQEWRKEDDVALAGATELQPRYLFEGVHGEGIDADGYSVEAELIEK
jgi:pyocin large subunit-like protein